MNPWKEFKTNIRKVLHRFGYDIVPFRPETIAPKSEKPEEDSGEKYAMPLYFDLFGEEAVQKRRFYNIGAGDFYHPAWTNVDLRSEWYDEHHDKIDLGWDMLSLEPIPVESNVAEIVYSSLVLEHITDDAAQHTLHEAQRILKEGGYLRVVVPDIDLYYRAYKEHDHHFYKKPNRESPEDYQRAMYNQNPNKASVQQNFMWALATSLSELHADGAPHRISDEEVDRIFEEMDYEQALDYIVSQCPIEIQRKYPHNHINWWNKEKMRRFLRQAGFENIYHSGFGQSFCPVMRNTHFFDHRDQEVCLYMEAIK